MCVFVIVRARSLCRENEECGQAQELFFFWSPFSMLPCLQSSTPPPPRPMCLTVKILAIGYEINLLLKQMSAAVQKKKNIQWRYSFSLLIVNVVVVGWMHDQHPSWGCLCWEWFEIWPPLPNHSPDTNQPIVAHSPFSHVLMHAPRGRCILYIFVYAHLSISRSLVLTLDNAPMCLYRWECTPKGWREHKEGDQMTDKQAPSFISFPLNCMQEWGIDEWNGWMIFVFVLSLPPSIRSI